MDAKWIRTIAEAIESTMTTSVEELVNIEEKDIYTSIKKEKELEFARKRQNNYWSKTLSTTHRGLATAINTNMNNDISLPDWLVEGKCVMIPKKENPQAKDHRPITLLNTMYKTITSVIDVKLKDHQEKHHIHADRPARVHHKIDGMHRQLDNR